MPNLKPEFIFLNQEDVFAAGANMDMALKSTEKVLKMHGTGDVLLPGKVVMDLDEKVRGRINALTAYLGGDVDCGGVKWIAGFPGNPRKYSLPRANAFIILNDCETGMPLAVMDGTYISASRTGAATGVGAKYLARKDSKIVCMIGNGPQATTQILALVKTMPEINEIRCFDINREASEAYAKYCSDELGLNAIVAKTPEEAVVGADIIVTVTVADKPIVKNKWLKQGYFFAHVGSYQEEEEEVINKADKIVVDEWDSVLHRVTPSLAQMYLQGKMPLERIHANIGEIIAGKKPGRVSDTENIFYSPIGLGSEDISMAYMVYQSALKKGVGTKLRLWSDKPDYKGV